MEENKYGITKVISETSKANSFEFGKAGSRHKVYYDTFGELREKIREAIMAEKYRNQTEIEVLGGGSE